MVWGNIPEPVGTSHVSIRKTQSLPSRTPAGKSRRKSFRPEAPPLSSQNANALTNPELTVEGITSPVTTVTTTNKTSLDMSWIPPYESGSKGWLRSAAEEGLPLWAVTRERGFLPTRDPPSRLRLTRLQNLEKLVEEVPKLVVAAAGKPGALREKLRGLEEADVMGIEGEAQEWRAFMALSFLAHAFVWADSLPPPDRLPKCLARPWCKLAEKLGMPPVLSYATYNLLNWRRLDPRGDVKLGNIVCLANFNGGLDEEWFRLIHVAIEQQAAPAIAAISDAHDAIRSGDVSRVARSLKAMKDTLCVMLETLKRMQTACDPHIYYHRVRPYTSGWRNSTELPQGLIYEGVSEEPRFYYGATGAQSAVLPALDAALGVLHPPGWLSDYLKVMREHMPGEHRRALQAIEQGPSIRAFVLGHFEQLAPQYDEALRELYAFRNQHKSFAFSYNKKQSKMVDEKGTGGTDYMPYLAKHARTTREHLLSNSDNV